MKKVEVVDPKKAWVLSPYWHASIWVFAFGMMLALPRLDESSWTWWAAMVIGVGGLLGVLVGAVVNTHRLSKTRRRGVRNLDQYDGVQRILGEFGSQVMKLQGERLGLGFHLYVRLYEELTWYDLTAEPAVCVDVGEDGALVLEWMKTRHRLGFAIEPKAEESGFFYCDMRDERRPVSLGGPLEEADVSELVRKFLS